jgi:3-dehydroquinate synthase
MKRYWGIAIGMVLLFGGIFAMGEALDLRFNPQFTEATALTAAVGVGLLIVDVLLPVPSSVIMVGHGFVFGWPLGAALSLLGSVAGAAVAFWIGRRGGPLLHRLIGPDEQARADALLARWGVLAIILTRPIPMFAETVALLAGASPMRWRTLLVGSLAGNLPPALLYAIAGSTATAATSGFAIFGIVMGITGVFWWIAR